MNSDPARAVCLPLASAGQLVRYVCIDDEPRYRLPLEVLGGAAEACGMEQVGSYSDVESFLSVHREPCHVVVLDLCLNRRTGDEAVLHGVRAIRHLARDLGHRILVHTSDPRPEPVARCVAAGALGFVSKYDEDTTVLPRTVAEIGRRGGVFSGELTTALAQLAERCRDVRLSASLEETLRLLDSGLTDAEVAERRHISPRTVEDHKRKILAVFGEEMERQRLGFGKLAQELGIAEGDLVNDSAGSRPARGMIRAALHRMLHPES